MKKEEIIRRCYGGMGERYGVETIILFHVGDSFGAYFDDAEAITRITEVLRFKMVAVGIPAIRIPDAALEECRNRLLDAGCKVCVSEVRGVPDCHILKTNEANTETGRRTDIDGGSNRSLGTVGNSGINHRNAEMLSDHGLRQH